MHWMHWTTLDALDALNALDALDVSEPSLSDNFNIDVVEISLIDATISLNDLGHIVKRGPRDFITSTLGESGYGDIDAYGSFCFVFNIHGYPCKGSSCPIFICGKISFYFIS